MAYDRGLTVVRTARDRDSSSAKSDSHCAGNGEGTSSPGADASRDYYRVPVVCRIYGVLGISQRTRNRIDSVCVNWDAAEQEEREETVYLDKKPTSGARLGQRCQVQKQIDGFCAPRHAVLRR